jgi:hypothetical protein
MTPRALLAQRSRLRRTTRVVAGAAALVAVGAALLTVPDIAATAAPAGTVAPTAARAADVSGIVPVTIASLTPVVPVMGDTLTIRGTVTNTAATTVRHVVVRLRVSPTPVRTRSEINDILAGSAGRTGVAVEASKVAVADSLEPGGKVAYSISVPLEALGLPKATAEVVVIGVESLGDVDGDGQGIIQTGLTRTFLPWFPLPREITPTPVVWLYPLTTAPSRLADGVFLDDHLAAEVGPRGRLTRLLDAADTAPTAVSWVVDPALLQSLQDMADGYVVRPLRGGSVAGTGGPAAATWLARLSSLSASAEVTASAYADPDVVALHRAGRDVDISLAATTAKDLPATLLTAPVASGLAWPAGEVADDGTLDVLRASGARVVVLSSTALPPSPPVNYTPSGSVDLATGGSPLRAAVADARISDLVAAPSAKADPGLTDPVVRRQAALAEIAMTTLELPSTPRTLVIAPGTRWAADAATTRDLVSAVAASPFARPARLADLMASPPSDIPRARTDYSDADRAGELSPAYVARVGRARSDLAGLRAVAPDTTTTSTSGFEETLTRAESSAWRSNPAGGNRLLNAVRSEIDHQIGLVQVLSHAPVTLPGDSGVIPVTVENGLDRPARVGVRLVGTPATRFVAADVPPTTLAPGEKATLEVNARVLGTGPVTVAISMLTPDGQAFGSAAHIEVRSAAYARAAQWVVGGLFGVLVLMLGVNFVRRRRTSAPSGRTGTDDDHGDGGPTDDDRDGQDVAHSGDAASGTGTGTAGTTHAAGSADSADSSEASDGGDGDGGGSDG